jgi:hypothetical protein
MDRFTWWYAMQPYLTGGHHQGNTRMAINEYQDRLTTRSIRSAAMTAKAPWGARSATAMPRF